MRGYYEKGLAAERLRLCYEVAPPETRAYLEAEIAFVSGRLRPDDRLLELGCGYGRILDRLAPLVREAWGIDTSLASLRLAAASLAVHANCRLAAVDAARLAFRGSPFDAVLCLQNGVSAFAVDPVRLFTEAVRAAREGGRVLFSSYARGFWPHRLAWFEAQAAHGLVDEIDREATRDGVIVCKDGFRAITLDERGFRELAAAAGQECRIVEVAGSSLFCIVDPVRRGPGSMRPPARPAA
jgi:2-polyprenyl-6-hydroxyphenyl methylase/3-demethylubiquinone-9 3-methyltransferase